LEEQQDTTLVVPVPSLPGTETFEFTTVIVDIQGKEISRRRGQTHYLTEDLGNGVTLEMVCIPGGTFLMGSPESEGNRYSNERPQHSVTVKSFLISKYPVTKAQWKKVAALPEVRQELKLRPSPSGGNSHPVTQVSWHDAVEFCDRLSQKTGHEYRLPTEAEWEYACRAGTTTPFHFGETITSTLANYDARESYRSKPQGSEATTTPVGSFQVANPFGLFDMHGNVWEWCLDQWHENYDNAPTTGDVWLYSSENQNRVMRGGSLLNDPSMCRSSSRLYKNASETFKHVGFRIVFSV
jgi:formylglycine-generating enzyme required for sulfatase activity